MNKNRYILVNGLQEEDEQRLTPRTFTLLLTPILGKCGYLYGVIEAIYKLLKGKNQRTVRLNPGIPVHIAIN